MVVLSESWDYPEWFNQTLPINVVCEGLFGYCES